MSFLCQNHDNQLNSTTLFSVPFSPPSILAEAKNLSFNATAAFKAYSKIKANIDAAEKEAKTAKQRANEALALVNPPHLTPKNQHSFSN